ncbi:MAG: hypothetical protein ACYCXG_03790 [Acidiferrobacter sp.]
MKKQSGILAVSLMVVALPALAASGVPAQTLQITLQHEGFTTTKAAVLARTAAHHYKGASLIQLATGFNHLPTLPKADYQGQTLKPRVAVAYARVISHSLTHTLAPAQVMVASHAFVQAVGAGTNPLATARLVTEGLADGLRGSSLAKLASHYAARIRQGIPEKTAYRETLSMARTSYRSPVGRPTAMNPAPGGMGANVNGVAGTGVGAGGMTGAMGSAAMTGGMAGPGGGMTGGGSVMGGGGMGRP